VAGHAFFVSGKAGGGRAAIGTDGGVGGPAGFVGEAFLVADPANVGADVGEDDGIRLELTDEFPGAGPVVVGAFVDHPFFACAAVETVASVGAVMPDLVDGAVVG
jgi:hypothetical protein